ncbi:hypothetical protein [Hymenobacter bucti]|uniref:Lipocalin-like domain-containing protein n=1 Tax=Hymenobacter bucti TaxID=1844114 RepID=A0ABW4QW63_9BACT
MKYYAFAIALGLGALAARPALAQNRVANYGYGQPGTAGYEHLSFWINNKRRTDIHYAHGKDRQDTPLRYAGLGQGGFKTQFPDRRTLYVVPSGNTLLVSTAQGAAPKTFTWEYEGPVNGVGTACSVCVADAAAAMRLLRTHYLR